MTDPSPDALAKAAHAYQANRKQWDYLGYTEVIALAVLAEFFSLERVRNPSQKPLNVLSMVGKSRVRAIADAVKAQQGEPAAPPAEEEQDGSG
ncbi:MAG: hypothetical protein H0T73_21355 [Ardenticatenales bacterium]|nr:hypothetical protein [Ardenticatenales bacterium]